MFDLKLIRETPGVFDSGWKRRGMDPQTPKIIAMDEKRRALLTESQELQSKRNEASKQIGAIKSKGGDAAELMQEVAKVAPILASEVLTSVTSASRKPPALRASDSR